MNSSMVYASNDDGQCNFLSLEAVKSEAVADANKLTLTSFQKSPLYQESHLLTSVNTGCGKVVRKEQQTF